MLLSLATVLVVAAVAHPAARLGRVLGWGPLRWLGVRSYGIYLWHAPIIVLTTPATIHGVQPLRAALQVAASVVVAALSWRYRRGADPPRRAGPAVGAPDARAVTGARGRSPRRRWSGLAAGVVVLGLAAVGLRRGPRRRLRSAHRPRPASAPQPALRSSSDPASGVPDADGDASGARPAASATTGGAPTDAVPRAARRGHRARRDLVPSVVHIGDSTSEGMISTDYLPDRPSGSTAQYARVGVRTERTWRSPARPRSSRRCPASVNAQQRRARPGRRGLSRLLGDRARHQRHRRRLRRLLGLARASGSSG